MSLSYMEIKTNLDYLFEDNLVPGRYSDNALPGIKRFDHYVLNLQAQESLETAIQN